MRTDNECKLGQRCTKNRLLKHNKYCLLAKEWSVILKVIGKVRASDWHPQRIGSGAKTAVGKERNAYLLN